MISRNVHKSMVSLLYECDCGSVKYMTIQMISRNVHKNIDRVSLNRVTLEMIFRTDYQKMVSLLYE